MGKGTNEWAGWPRSVSGEPVGGRRGGLVSGGKGGSVGGRGWQWVEGEGGGQWVEVGSFPPAVLYVKVRLSCLKALPSFGGVKSLPSCKNVFGKLSN